MGSEVSGSQSALQSGIGLLGVQLTQLHALEVQTCAAASSWEKPDGHDSGVLAGLVSKICNNTPSSCA